MRKIIYTMIMGIMLFTVTLTGCDNKINQKNYNQIKMGMKYDKVVDLLGEPDSCDSAMAATNCMWGNENRYIQVKFVSDQVILFSSKGI